MNDNVDPVVKSLMRRAAGEVISGLDAGPADLLGEIGRRRRQRRFATASGRVGMVVVLLIGAGVLVRENGALTPNQAGFPPTALTSSSQTPATAQPFSCENLPPVDAPPKQVELGLDVKSLSDPASPPFNFEARLLNSGSTTFRMMPGAPRVDFWVTDKDGRVIWVWSRHQEALGQTFVDPLTPIEVPPTKRLSFNSVWDGGSCEAPTATVPPGRYRVHAVWLTVTDNAKIPIVGWPAEPIAIDIE